MKTLPKNYDHTEAEARWQKEWESNGVYHWDESRSRDETFVIDTPPPTVSGVLHMGHIFSYTQADFVARYQRMKGKTVFYPMGFDDNGLPTERLVEKEKKVRGSAMPRDEFVALCREVVKSAEEEFRQLFKSVALSVDWRQEYQTISDDVRTLSQMSFLDLAAKEEVYRDFRPTYWDWVDQTAIAQAEIENKEMPGTMNEILFTLEDGTPLHIATTRPELLGACVAVMYHPEDPNAAKYAGKTAITPVFGVKVPMIDDELVERDKGTGLVMCCTFGDDADKEWWRKHELPSRAILSKEGKISFGLVDSYDNQPTLVFIGSREGSIPNHPHLSYSRLSKLNCTNFDKTLSAFRAIEGLKPKKANAKMLELLQAEGKLIKQDNITHTVKCAERSGTPIEIIPTHQWFVRVVDKKEALLAKGAECTWWPDFMKIRLNQWIEGLKEDWCISRQRFFGVPFPVWYVLNLKTQEHHLIYAEINQLPVDPITDTPIGFSRNTRNDDIRPELGVIRYSGIATSDILDNQGNVIFKSGQEVIIQPVTDVMDTWATSSISPQINAKGISSTMGLKGNRYDKLFPADLRPQAHEIIRTWAFYTIVKACLHANNIPWKNVMISGWCLAADKTKMSKSKGNVVTPVDLIREKGADVVRYWASTSRLATDTAFSEDLLKIGRKLQTKLWNATIFSAIHLPKLNENSHGMDYKSTSVLSRSLNSFETLDRWILSRLQVTIAKATEEFEKFEYCNARVAIEEFFWKDFCDNYLELVKARAYGEIGEPIAHTSAHITLYHCLNAILRLLAPFMPHITEELYQGLFEEKSIHACGNWPNAADYPYDAAAEASGKACVEILEAVRKAKSERNVSIKYPIRELMLSAGSANKDGEAVIAPVLEDLKSAGTISSILWQSKLEQGVETDSKQYLLSVTFEEQASVA